MRTKQTARKSTGGIAPRINLGAADTKPAASNNPSTVFNDEEKKSTTWGEVFGAPRGVRHQNRRVDSDDDEPQPSVSLASAVASKRKAVDDDDDDDDIEHAALKQAMKQAMKQAKESVHLDDDVIRGVNKSLAELSFIVEANIPAKSTIAGEEIRGTTVNADVTVFSRGIQVCLSKVAARMHVSVILEGEFEPDTGLLDASSAMVSTVCPQIKNFDTAPMNVLWVVSRHVSLGYPRRVKYTLNSSGHTIEIVLPHLIADLVQYELAEGDSVPLYTSTSDAEEDSASDA